MTKPKGWQRDYTWRDCPLCGRRHYAKPMDPCDACVRRLARQ